MKNNIIKIMAVMIAIGASAFTTLKKPLTKSEMNNQAQQNWYFESGHALGDAVSETNWNTSPQANCDAENQVPCQIQFEADDYMSPSTKTPLQNYLDSKGSAAVIRSTALSRRTQ